MKTKKICGFMLATMLLLACSDDPNLGPDRQKGFLYFNVSEAQGWANGNQISRASAEAPILMENSLSGGEPIYLQTEVAPTVSPQLEEMLRANDETEAQTRGIRYTGDVFAVSSAGSPKISSIGVYATRTIDRGAILNFTEITPDGTESSTPYPWNVKEQEIEDVWDSGTADFYGYAPYFASTNSNGLSLSADASTGIPTLTYTVPADVANQLDILTAKHLNVAKGSDVELEFSHIMAAIKFNFTFGKGMLSDGNWVTKGDFTWSNGLNTYDVSVSNIAIRNVYYKEGSWKLGDDPYGGGTWTRSNTETTDFTYSLTKDLSGESSSPVQLNPDEGGNVFMMLPQEVPANAAIEITCQIVNTTDATDTKTMTLTAALKETDGSTPKTWAAGYTYTYTISLSDIAYVFDYNTATAKNYTNVPFAGTSEEDVFIRSYKLDSKGTKANVEWEIQYQDTVASVTGVGGSGSDNVTWKTGTNGWMHIFDRSTGSYATEVTSTHAGANEGDTDNDKLFKIQVGSIMEPVYDLSIWNQTQTKRWKRSTSNCYIVAGPGTYRIPLIYGNAWTNGNKNEAAYKTTNTGSEILSTFVNYNNNSIKSPFINIDIDNTVNNACLIWEEVEGLITVEPTIDTAVTGEDDYNTNNGDYKAGANYLRFTIDPAKFTYGNAVVGIRDASGTIVWSWHIWITDPNTFLGGGSVTLDNHPFTFAKTNVGWVDGGVSVAATTRKGNVRLVQKESGYEITFSAEQNKRRAFTTYLTNCLYQWGRKDPMRGITSASHDGTNDGAPRASTGVRAWSNPYSGLGTKKAIHELIQDPNTIWGASRGDLYTKSYYNLWGMNCTKNYYTNPSWSFFGKTIYDPCPVGYCVPPGRALLELSRSNFSEIERGASLPIICDYTDGGTTIKFHCCGTRTTDTFSDNKARGFGLTPANGFFHTATPASSDESWQLRIYFHTALTSIGTDPVDTHNHIRGDHETANCVFPVLYGGEVVDEDESKNITVKTSESGWENGTDETLGTEIM